MHMNILLQKATRQHTKDHNSRMVLRTIYDAGEISRADLARLTHLTRTTVSEVVSGLIEQGLVEEVGQGPTAVGRTPTLLSVVDDARHVVAVTITKSEVQGAVINLRGAIQHQAQLPVVGLDGQLVLAQLHLLIESLINVAHRPLLGIGISTPGLLDTQQGVVRRAVNFGWHDVPLREIVQERHRLPVYIANDSHMMALAEYMFGEHQHTPNLVAVKVGNGIGAGIVLHGQLFASENYGAGEIGHVVVEPNGPRCQCGNRGCLEAVANIPAIVERAREAAQADTGSLLYQLTNDGTSSMTIEMVLHAFLNGDATAQAIMAETGRLLGIAVANLVSILGIRRIVITGRIVPFGEPLRDIIREEVRCRILPDLAQVVEIDILPQPPEAVLLGATALLLTSELGLGRLHKRLAHEDKEDLAA
jgi:predicted NBD/HSP70 family sugar kinase